MTHISAFFKPSLNFQCPTEASHQRHGASWGPLQPSHERVLGAKVPESQTDLRWKVRDVWAIGLASAVFLARAAQSSIMREQFQDKGPFPSAQSIGDRRGTSVFPERLERCCAQSVGLDKRGMLRVSVWPSGPEHVVKKRKRGKIQAPPMLSNILNVEGVLFYSRAWLVSFNTVILMVNTESKTAKKKKNELRGLTSRT